MTVFKLDKNLERTFLLEGFMLKCGNSSLQLKTFTPNGEKIAFSIRHRKSNIVIAKKIHEFYVYLSNLEKDEKDNKDKWIENRLRMFDLVLVGMIEKDLIERKGSQMRLI